MIWPNAIFAASTHRCKSAVQGFIRSFPVISAGGSAIAQPTLPKPKPSLPQPLEQSLHARAIRVCNREPRAIAKYMSVHQSLHRGR